MNSLVFLQISLAITPNLFVPIIEKLILLNNEEQTKILEAISLLNETLEQK